MQITGNKVVTFDFTVMDDQGRLIESSKDSGSMSYLHGDGRIAPGLEKALEGRAIGDTFSVLLTPSQGFGERDESLIHTFTTEELAGLGELETGMQLQSQDEEVIRTLTITKIEDDKVILDENHPLAGKTVTFDITILNIRSGTEEELGFDPAADVKCNDDCTSCNLHTPDTDHDHDCGCGGDCAHH